MKKKVEVAILPTEDRIKRIYQGDKSKNLYYSENPDAMFSYTAQHLYITVSQDVEPIKEGDYIPMYDEHSNKLVSFKKWDGKMLLSSTSFKVIATTDPKLVIECKKGTCTRGCSGHYHKCMESKPLPQVQQSFLKEFIANPYGEWEVEYVDWNDTEDAIPFKPYLKLNQDNFIVITPVKEEIILTRAQLKNILHCATGNVKDFVMHEDRFINDWIEENL